MKINWRRWLREILIILAIFYAVDVWQTRNMLSTDGDVQVKTFTLPLLAGGVGELAPVPGKQTLVYFFAPWCSVCRASMANLEYVDREFTQVLVVALDYQTSDEVAQFMAEVGLDYPVYMGNAEVREVFQISAYPSYYLLDEAFRVVRRAMGYSTALGLKLRT